MTSRALKDKIRELDPAAPKAPKAPKAHRKAPAEMPASATIVRGEESQAAPVRLVTGFEEGKALLKDAPPEPKDAAPVLECHKCGCRHLEFVDARKYGQLLIRDLECRNCGARVTDRVELAQGEEGTLGIPCGFCGGTLWKVRDTDIVPGAIRRYRICLTCGRTRTTHEK